MFGLPVDLNSTPSNPNFLQGDPVLLFNARSCIRLVIDKIKPRQVWLPSYLTDDILAGINQEIPTIFYPVNSSLNISNDEFIKNIHKEDLFLFIDYFGFPLLLMETFVDPSRFTGTIYKAGLFEKVKTLVRQYQWSHSSAVIRHLIVLQMSALLTSLLLGWLPGHKGCDRFLWFRA